MSVLQDAERLILNDRQKAYGHPADDFRRVTDAAAALGVDPINGGALHHALYMVLVKVARLVVTPHHYDSVVDGAGYFGTYELIVESKGEDYGWKN